MSLNILFFSKLELRDKRLHEKNTHNNALFAKSLHNHRSYFVDEKYRLNFNSSEKEDTTELANFSSK